MRTRQITESERTYRMLLAAVEAGEEVPLSRYGYGMLVAHLLSGPGRATSPPSRWGEARRVLESPMGEAADQVTPLD